MGRSPCCDKVGLKKGPWTPEEDQKLLAYIEQHGHGSWRALPAKARLQRCGKSCRLRWTNYLRPDIKRGKFSLQEEQTIIQLHALLGNRWSAIATHLPKRTDNEIKNYWNTHLKKRLTKMGIDPVTHKPKNDALLSSDGQSDNKTAANLSHMTQWESARLEAEARLVRESKLRSNSHNNNNNNTNNLFSASLPNIPSSSRSIDVLKTWNNGGWLKSNGIATGINVTTNTSGGDHHLESSTSTLPFSENNNVPPIMTSGGGIGENSNNNPMPPVIEFVETTSSGNNNSSETGFLKEEGNDQQNQWNKGCYEENGIIENSMSFTSSSLHEMTMTMEATTWGSSHHHESLINTSASTTSAHVRDVEEGFTSLLININSDDRSLSSNGGGGESNNNCDDGGNGGCSDLYDDNKNYWNSIFNLVISSPSHSPVF